MTMNNLDIHYGQPHNAQTFTVPMRGIDDLEFYDRLATELKTFVLAVKAKYPYLSFGISNDVYVGDRIIHRVYVYMPEHCYTLGAIAYGDFRRGDYSSEREEKKEFVVWSPNIRNMRIKDGNGRYRASSSSIDKAVSIVGKQVRPFTSTSYLMIAGERMVNGYANEINSAREKTNKARSKITSDPNMYWQDLLNIHSAQKAGLSEPPKLTPTLSNFLDDYVFQVGDTQELIDKATCKVLQVRVTADGFEVNPIQLSERLLESDYSTAYGTVDFGPMTRYLGDSLPKHIQEKISTLDMVHATNTHEASFLLGVGWISYKKRLYYIVDI